MVLHVGDQLVTLLRVRLVVVADDELWLYRVASRHLERITSAPGAEEHPSFSPDGKRIAFATDVHNVQFDIYSVGSDGKRQRRVTVTSEDSFEPAWSSDGATIAYSEAGAIYSKNAADDEYAEAKRLTDAANNDSSPQWRPVTADAGRRRQNVR
jgi:TolB protein